MPVKINMNKNWSKGALADMKVGLLEVVVDIHARSAILTPKDTRALVNSGRIEPITNGYKIIYGSDRVPYARKQFYTNRSNSRWLTKAADSVTRGSLAKYFRVGK